jgi:hypothetical protein
MVEIHNLSIGDIFSIIGAIELALESRHLGKNRAGELLEIKRKLLCVHSLEEPDYNPPAND